MTRFKGLDEHLCRSIEIQPHQSNWADCEHKTR